jgi:hypothetical protein
MKRLVLMVEGEGDKKAVKSLAVKLLERFCPGWSSHFFIDDHSMKVGDICSLLSPKEGIKLIRQVGVAGKKSDIGGVLILLDGDADFIFRQSDNGNVKEMFCPATTATYMSDLVKKNTRAGQTFSFVVVFANQEFESWFLAGHPKFEADYAGKKLEEHPRDAKGEIKRYDPRYNEAVNQKDYVADLDLDLLLDRMRSFRRFKHALEEIYQSIQTELFICSPSR